MKSQFSILSERGIWRRALCLLCILGCCSLTAFGQKRVTGTVADVSGEPVVGANVVEKGTTNGIMTDLDGRFALDVAGSNSVLQISFIGYVTEEITVGSSSSFSVMLKEDAQLIDEVVVIGYGTVRKSDLTGSLVSISNEKFKNLPQGGVTNILQGKAAGVNITTTSGAGENNIRIRGITSLNKSNEPLWVVDGVIDGQIGNFYDIQSIEVLKDASSTAIYGSQGANGVILVTTKKAQAGKARVTFDMRYGWKTLRKTPDLLSPYEYATAWNDFNGTGAISDADMAAYKAGTKGIDWIDVMTQTGFSQNYNLNISGGSGNTRYGITVWGGDTKGQLVTTTSRDYNVKATLDTDISPWLSLSGYMYGYTNTAHNRPSQGVFSDIVIFTPCMEIQDENGVYNIDPFSPYGNSPLGEVKAKYTDYENAGMTGFADLKVKFPVDGLTLSLQGLYTRKQAVERYFKSSKLYLNSPNEASNRSDQEYSWRNINNLTYQKEFGDHRFTAMGVVELYKREWSRMLARARNLPQEEVGHWRLQTGADREAENDYQNSAMVSAFGRIIYSYKGKYLFTGTYRADAPSQFRDKYKWGYFPSAAIGWNMGEEDFMNKDMIQQLKLRASVGSTGNHGVGAYATLAELTQDNAVFGLNQQFPGFWLNKFTNPDIHWEKTIQYDLGFDLGILDQRLNLTVDWFKKNTTDLLFEKNLPLYNGGGTVWTNQGSMQNTGWEFTVNAYPVQTKDLIWETNLTATYTNNVIKDLAGEERIIPDQTRGGKLSACFAMEPGKPVGVFYLFDWAGFDNEGANLYRTADGGLTNTPSAADRILTGNSIPKWIFGWNNQLTYKNWDMNVFLRGTGKYNRLNLSRFFQSSKTASAFVATREAYYLNWEKVADKSHAEFASFSNAKNQVYGPSTQWLENGQFLRLQNLTLGYLVPKKLAKIADIHLSASVENLFVLTPYKGMDPETVSEVNDTYKDKTFGLDDGSFPLPRTYTLILRFDF